MTATAADPRRLPLLDGLRGVAAIGVMLYHLGNVFHFASPFSRSYLFVDFFFLLSGFVLTLAAEPRMNAGWGAWRFIHGRVRRPWPMIAVGSLVGGIAALGMQDPESLPLKLALALLLIPMISGPGQIFPLNGPQWSLLFEIIANVFHALILRRLGNPAILALALVSAAALIWLTVTLGSNTTGPFAFNWWYGLPRVAFAYTLGIWIARKWIARSHRPLISWTSAVSLPLIVTIMLPGLPLSVAIGDALAVVVVMPLLFWFAATSAPPTRAEPWLARLGALSFPLYAVHLPVLELFGRLGQSWPLALGAAACSVILAHVLAIALEPGRRASALPSRGPAPGKPRQQAT